MGSEGKKLHYTGKGLPRLVFSLKSKRFFWEGWNR